MSDTPRTDAEMEDMLYILRNPWGWDDKEVRQARLDAADEIERLKRENAALQQSLTRLTGAEMTKRDMATETRADKIIAAGKDGTVELEEALASECDKLERENAALLDERALLTERLHKAEDENAALRERLKWTRDRWDDIADDANTLAGGVAVGGLLGGIKAVAENERYACDAALAAEGHSQDTAQQPGETFWREHAERIRASKCPACGYVESHDPNCPRPEARDEYMEGGG